MSSAKVAVGGALVAVVLAGCGTTTKPIAGTIPPTATTEGHARIDDPRSKHVNCLRQHKIRVAEIGQTWLQIDTPPGGPRIDFKPTPGSAQYAQITGQVGGAEVIGSALVYPDQASDKELQTIENCVAQGVSG